MKRFYLCILLGFLTLAVPAQQKPGEIDLKINGIGLGSAYSEVIKRFKKPLRKTLEKTSANMACSGADETHLTLFYKGLEISLLGDGKALNMHVVEIEVVSNKWTASKINIGADIQNVKEEFGQPNSESKLANRTILYYVSKGNSGWINFEFLNNKLVRISTVETLC